MGIEKSVQTASPPSGFRGLMPLFCGLRRKSAAPNDLSKIVGNGADAVATRPNSRPRAAKNAGPEVHAISALAAGCWAGYSAFWGGICNQNHVGSTYQA